MTGLCLEYMIRYRLTKKGLSIMADFAHHARQMSIPSISPYLLRPLRTREQALADIAAADFRKTNITPLVMRHTAERKASSKMVAA